MKKLSFLISLLLLTAVFTAPLSVSAAQNAGIKPGSFFYGFVTTFEKVNLFFTFNPEKKAEKAFKYAEKRLAEAEAVAGDENPDAVKTAISGYEKNIVLAAEASKKVKDETKAENLLNLIAKNTSKHQEILSDVLSQVPDEAKEAITKALEASRKGQEEAIKKIAELKQEVAGLKQEVAELKKQQRASSTAPAQNIGAQSQPTSIKELKKEIEGLKKQAAEKEEREKQAITPATLAPSSIPATTSQTETKAKGQTVTLTNSFGISYTFEDPMINQQRIRDLINIGFVVTKGELPEGIIIKPNIEVSTPTPILVEPLKIVSVNISSTFNTMAFEWTTNKLTQSKIFLSSTGDTSLTVHQSESGLSTRHIAHIYNLNGNTTYLYEIETVADTEIIKKQGSFSTKQVKENAQVKIVVIGGSGCNVNVDRRYCNIEVYYFENNERTNANSVTISADDNGVFGCHSYNNLQCGGGEPTDTSGTRQGNPITGFTRPGGSDGQPVAYFTYIPSASGTRTLTAIVNGVINTITVMGQITDQ